jgi:hypothetical protein
LPHKKILKQLKQASFVLHLFYDSTNKAKKLKFFLEVSPQTWAMITDKEV